MSEPKLTEIARNTARQMSYEAGNIEAKAKFLLLELSSKLDERDISVRHKTDGLMIVNGYGQVRYLNLKETLKFRLFGVLPQKV